MAAAWTTQNWDFGGAVSYSETEVTASPFSGRVITFHGTDAARTVNLPDARHWSSGMLFAVVINEQSTNSAVVKDAAGSTIVTIPAGNYARVWLRSNDSLAGQWFADLRGVV